jgi:hypothetical protein
MAVFNREGVLFEDHRQQVSTSVWELDSAAVGLRVIAEACSVTTIFYLAIKNFTFITIK